MPYRNASELVSNKDELLIIFAGDSHTWGQGADGWSTALEPPFVSAELRRLPQSVRCFAQLFTEYLEMSRGDKKTLSINAGYGCATTSEYLSFFWQRAVAAFDPDIGVIEFGINDWLDIKTNIEVYRRNLHRMIDSAQAMGSFPILLSTSPIMGESSCWGDDYADYVAACRQVGTQRDDVAFADANALMTQWLADCRTKAERQSLFDNDWHTSQIGHELYARALTDCMKRG